MPNGFAKGTDASPDEDCLGSADDCGGAPLGGVATTGGPGLPGSAALQAAMATQDVHAPGLMAQADVVGLEDAQRGAPFGRCGSQEVGMAALEQAHPGEAGDPVIEIYVRNGPPAGLPVELDGVPTRIVVTGDIDAF